jgi:Holliday junction DNA helicase RuvA
MIGRLTGHVVADELDGTVVLDVHGVGYEVLTPLGTVGRVALPADGSGRITLSIHTHVREDALSLYGFASETERSVFRTLLGIPNIGPKTALTVLSALPAAELARAVADEDVKRLTQVPGIGKKSAERLLLELRGKLVHVEPGTTTAPSKAKASRQAELLTGALTNMGYRLQEAERALAHLGDRTEQLPLADLLKESLAVLAK